MDRDIRLAYSGLTNQVRVSFRVEEVEEQSRPPRDLLRRAKSKLQEEQSKGQIERFALYDDALNQLWSYLQRAKIKGRLVNFVLAQGYRPMRDATLHQEAGRVWSLNLPDQKASLEKFPWYKYLAWSFAEIGSDPYRDGSMRAALLEAYFRASSGERVRNFKLRPAIVESEGAGVKIVHEKEHQRVLLYVYEGSSLVSSESSKELLLKINSYLDRLLEKAPSYQALRKEVQDLLKELQSGPESLGFGLPLIVPVAISAVANTAVAAVKPQEMSKRPQLTEEKAAAVKASPKKNEMSTNSSEKALISFYVSDDALEARVAWSDDEKLGSGHYDTDRSWLDRALKEAGIVFGYENYVEKLLSLLTLGQSLKGQVIARGVAAQTGEDIYLHPSYLHKRVSEEASQVNLRSAQNKLIVEVGDLVCEPRFRDGKQGTDVFGKSVVPTLDPNLSNIEVGPGIERRQDGKYYASIRGIPKIERLRVRCLDAYIHVGDVNLKSGDIHFDGHVEVRGNIDSGARVYAKGDLIVRGSIGQAKVRCEGDLNVSKGIVTSQDGVVFVGGHAYAQFIENSRLTVGQTLEVQRSLMNSDIRVGGDLVIRSVKQGLIGGGSIVVQHAIWTYDLGFSDGEKTTLRIGSDWRIEYRVSLLLQRAIRLRRYVQQKQIELEEARKRPGDPRQVTLEKRLQRARKVLDKIEQKMEVLRARIRWSDQALLIVKGRIDHNVEITIGGRGVVVKKATREVMITGSRFRDQFINPLLYLEQYQKQLGSKAS